MAILAAGREVFARVPYSAVTIDDIAGAAGISRVTFYAHFDSKLALAAEIWQSKEARWHPLFTHLIADAANGRVDRAYMVQWIGDLQTIYETDRYISLLASQLAFFEVDFRSRLALERQQIIDTLAAEVPHLIPDKLTPTERAWHNARLHLLLMRLDHHCMAMALDHGGDHYPIYTEIIADEWVAALNCPCPGKCVHSE